MRLTLVGVLVCIGLLAASAGTVAAVVVIPENPLSTQPITIRLTNHYRSQASIATATIARNGSQFTISQTVNVTCGLPAAPVLTSNFSVGPLPAGTYQVVAEIQQVAHGRGCVLSPQTETARFTVGEAIGVPTQLDRQR